MGQQFRLAFDEIGTSQRRNTEVRLTHSRRELDPNRDDFRGLKQAGVARRGHAVMPKSW